MLRSWHQGSLPSKVPWPAGSPKPSREPRTCRTLLHLNISTSTFNRHLKVLKNTGKFRTKLTIALLWPAPLLVFISESITSCLWYMALKNVYSFPRKSAKSNFQNIPYNPPTHKLSQMKLNSAFSWRWVFFSAWAIESCFISNPQTPRLLILLNVKINISEVSTWREISRQLQVTSNKET